LDRDLWAPRLFGSVGPRGLGLSAATDNQYLYAPLYDWHLEPPSLPSTSTGEVLVITSASGISHYPHLVDEVDRSIQAPLIFRDNEIFGTVAVRGALLLAAMIASPDYEEPSMARILYGWTNSSDPTAVGIRIAVWHQLQHEAAMRGHVALATRYQDGTPDEASSGRLQSFSTPRQTLESEGHMSMITGPPEGCDGRARPLLPRVIARYDFLIKDGAVTKRGITKADGTTVSIDHPEATEFARLVARQVALGVVNRGVSLMNVAEELAQNPPTTFAAGTEFQLTHALHADGSLSPRFELLSDASQDVDLRVLHEAATDTVCGHLLRELGPGVLT